MPKRKSNSRKLSIKNLSNRSALARDRSLHVLSAMRKDPKLSFARAARLQGVKPATVRKYFPSVLTKANGRFRAKRSDRYSATLFVPDSLGNSIPVKTRNSKERKQLSQYLRDLGRYLRGNRNALSDWHGKKIGGVELLTSGRALENIEPALSDFSLYRGFNGTAA